SAATSLKPKTVIKAINDYNQNYSINSHSENSSPLFKKSREEEIVFLPSTTYALNILALSLKCNLQAGDRICLTHLEHSANLHPWQALAQKEGVIVDYLPLNKEFTIDIDKLNKHINKQTKIVSFVQVSNSLGVINPVMEITKKIKEINPKCLVIIDACQRSGKKIGPAEKDVELNLPLSQKFEVGTLPLAEIFGLKAAFEFLDNFTASEIYEYENNLRHYTLQKLKTIKNLVIYNQNLVSANIITFNLPPYHAHDIADYLGKNNIYVRAGNFCCPYLDKLIGTNSALRISFGIYNDYNDIDKLIFHLQKIIQNPQVLLPF
ncbi:26591_t:CDS:2, partial [Racocetra persica]